MGWFVGICCVGLEVLFLGGLFIGIWGGFFVVGGFLGGGGGWIVLLVGGRFLGYCVLVVVLLFVGLYCINVVVLILVFAWLCGRSWVYLVLFGFFLSWLGGVLLWL